MDEIIEQCHDNSITDTFKINNEKFMHWIPSSCDRAGKSVALFTDSGIKAAQASTNALMDATFKFFPSFIKQLFIIHSYIGFL